MHLQFEEWFPLVAGLAELLELNILGAAVHNTFLEARDLQITQIYINLHIKQDWKIFLIIKSTSYSNFSNLFWNETVHVADSSSVHHQQLFTVHSAMVYVIQVRRQLSSGIRMD
jgi:hypothetical protein